LTADGVLGRETWISIYDTYRSILDTSRLIDGGVTLFPGQTLRQGSQGDDVATIQEYLQYISQTYTQIPAPSVTGVFGQETANSVTAFQQFFGLNANGAVGPTTWDAIATLYSDLRFGNVKRLGQFPGNTLTEEAGL
jgi:peptidoglycan hydrolase-like protein with peptidoglycan-binding domain